MNGIILIPHPSFLVPECSSRKLRHQPSIQQRIIRMKQFLAQLGTLREDGDLFRSARQGGGGKRRRRDPSVKIVDAAASEDAGTWILLAHSRLVVAGPAQAAR